MTLGYDAVCARETEEGRNRRSGRSVSLLLFILTIALMLSVSAPAFAKSASGDQYASAGEGQYGFPADTIGGKAARDALIASGAFGSAPSGAASASAENEPGVESTGSNTTENKGVASEDKNVASEGDIASIESGEAPTEGQADDSEATAKPQADNEGGSKIVKLPKTGGVSPLWLGVPLVASALLVCGVALRVLDR